MKKNKIDKAVLRVVVPNVVVRAVEPDPNQYHAPYLSIKPSTIEVNDGTSSK